MWFGSASTTERRTTTIPRWKFRLGEQENVNRKGIKMGYRRNCRLKSYLQLSLEVPKRSAGAI